MRIDQIQHIVQIEPCFEPVAAHLKPVSRTGDCRMRRRLPAAVARDDQASLPAKAVRSMNESIESRTLIANALQLGCRRVVGTRSI